MKNKEEVNKVGAARSKPAEKEFAYKGPYPNLMKFMLFLKDNYAQEMAMESLRNAKEMELPIMKLFAHVPEEALIAQSVKSFEDNLNSLMDGSYIEKQKLNLKLWEEDKLPGIARDSIKPSDLVLVYASQKKTFLTLLPLYTREMEEVISIIQQSDELNLKSQEAAINLMFRLSKDAEEKANKTSELLKASEESLDINFRKLEAVNKELEAFSYSVSHDLRAPLRAIHGYGRILLDDYMAKLDDDAKSMLNSIVSNTIKMGQLIDDLLAFSRLGKKELNIMEVDMGELAKVALHDVTAIYPDMGNVKVTIKPLLPAKADYALMEQVFANLISNAVKYSGKNASPEIEISSYSADGEKVYCVKDNGVGFDMRYYDKLFGVFQRLHSNAEFEGTGVGLALVKRIVTRHKGRVWAEAEPNKGATFYIALNN